MWDSLAARARCWRERIFVTKWSLRAITYEVGRIYGRSPWDKVFKLCFPKVALLALTADGGAVSGKGLCCITDVVNSLLSSKNIRDKNAS